MRDDAPVFLRLGAMTCPLRRPLGVVMAMLGALALLAPAAASAAGPGGGSQIRHVFVIVLENQSVGTTFGPSSPAPYLATTLRSRGAYIPNYFGIGHNSNPNYIAMISGQAPNSQTQADCQIFTDMLPGTVGANGQALGTGCVYPAAVPTLPGQLIHAGLSWRAYNEDMGADPAREASVCGHPALGARDSTQAPTVQDQYATRHDPFVYFHGIIDNPTLCNTHVVGLGALAQDLRSLSSVPNYSFIVPNLCNDGHDTPCKTGQPGGLVSANSFLQQWVPQITASPAYRRDGLVMVLFDEAGGQQPVSCCGEIPGPGSPSPGIGGPGGGQTGAVFLSPCIAPGTVTQSAYNHYSMLASVEDLFGLTHLGDAAGPGATPFGSDIYNRACGPVPPSASVHAPPLLSSVGSSARIPLRLSSSTAGGTGLRGYTIAVRDLGTSSANPRTILTGGQSGLRYHGRLGHSYAFSVTASNLAGQVSPVATATVLVPSGVRPARGHYSRGWRVARARGAWQSRSISSRVLGSAFALRYSGGLLLIIGERTPAGGVMQVTLDGRSRLVRLHAGRRQVRQVLYRAAVRSARHRLTVRVLRGTVALEGFAILARRA